VLELIVQGLPNKEIARRLNLAVGTVKIHVAVLFHKMNVTSRTAAAVAGARLLAASPPQIKAAA
jgi:DNA-binding NarL/FixJ family response regulator